MMLVDLFGLYLFVIFYYDEMDGDEMWVGEVIDWMKLMIMECWIGENLLY